MYVGNGWGWGICCEDLPAARHAIILLGPWQIPDSLPRPSCAKSFHPLPPRRFQRAPHIAETRPSWRLDWDVRLENNADHVSRKPEESYSARIPNTAPSYNHPNACIRLRDRSNCCLSRGTLENFIRPRHFQFHHGVLSRNTWGHSGATEVEVLVSMGSRVYF